MMQNALNIWDAVRGGQQAEQGMAQAKLEGMSLAERLAFKKAAGALGNQNYFAGYEGVPGAERPAYLKEAWANASPEEALKLESLVAEPFKIQRSVETAGKVEAAKKASDLEYNKNMMREFFQSEGGQGANAFGQAMSGDAAPGRAGSVPVSASSSIPSTALSATEKNFEIGPQGPKFGLKRMSPFEQSLKVSEDEARRAGTKLGMDKFAQDKVQNAETNFLNAQKQLQEGLRAAQMHEGAPGMVEQLYQQY
ncbi:MAG: hypothetical protein HOP00_07970 [Nitrospira sp.]|nr:hypothetical protein [Nitrospira sp.]